MKGLNFELRFYALHSLSVQSMSRVARIHYFYNTNTLRLKETLGLWNELEQTQAHEFFFRMKLNTAGSKENNFV